MSKKFIITNTPEGTYDMTNPIPVENFEEIGGSNEESNGTSSVEWADILNKPTTFTPSAHTHVKADITDFAHTHLWADITDKPTEFNPTPHNHDDRYFTETESDNRFFNVTGDDVVGDSSFTGKTTYDGDVYYNTQNGQKGVYLSRYEESTAEFVKMYLEDIVANFYYKNDERHARFKWTIENTDTESNAGANANTHTFEFLGNEFGAYLYLDGQEIIHSGNISNFQAGSHTHTKSDITDFAHTHPWSDITGAPDFIDTETDPTVPQYVKDITSTNITNWGTAYNKRITGLSITGTSTKTVTITLGDGTEVTGSFTDIVGTSGTSDGNDYVSSASFNDTTGVITLTRIDGGTVTVDIDNRYALQSHSHTWADITNKPTTFTPSAHSHSWSEITGKPSTFTPSAHSLDSHSNVSISSNTSGEILKWNGTNWVNNTLAEAGIASTSHNHSGTYEPAFSKNTAFNKNFGTSAGQVLEGNWRPTWGEVTGKPSTFTPSAHSHSWAEITSKPSTFTPSSHTHPWSDITGVPTYDNYSYWRLGANASYTNIGRLTSVNFVGSGASSVSRSGNTITISSTDTDTNTNYYVNSANFDIGNGVLTLGRSGLGSVTEDLDGRYAILSTANTFTGNITAPKFYQTSLRKWKENIENFKESGLSLVGGLKIVEFDYIGGESNNIGVIADETASKFLSNEKDAVNLYNTIFIQAKAIQELKGKVDSQEERISRLEKLLENLSNG